MRTLLLLALATPLAAQVTEPQGYHIVKTPPGESHATPAPAAPGAPAASGKRIRRPASHGQSAPGGGFRAPSMPMQITGRIRKR